MTNDNATQDSAVERPRAAQPPREGSPNHPAGDAPLGSAPHIVLDASGVTRALTRIGHEILERNDDAQSLYLVGVPNGGVPLARFLAQSLQELSGHPVVAGVLDTTLYRDDLAQSGSRPMLRPTEMPSAVDDRNVILVDDVVSTGRTVRAAMDALMDFGRPRSVQLVGLIDRGHRELPIKIDFVGKNIPTERKELVQLRRVDPESDWPLEAVLWPEGGGR